MSGETLYEAPRRYNVTKMRVHDYLYDSAFIVSGARDYARTAFKAAMASAQVILQPDYNNMFSDTQRPRIQLVYHTNCRLPNHVDPSYQGYVRRFDQTRNLPLPDLVGRDQVKYYAAPRKILPVKAICPDFHPPTPTYAPMGPTKPRNRGTQSIFRESSAQTIPWQPDGKAADSCEKTPEVLYLDKFEWGPGRPYRTGDLPADFHTTEIINKMRHARMWTELVEKGDFPSWMKKRDAIITDVETKDWIFREAEIDELQGIRLELLHRMQNEERNKQTNKTSKKLAKLWACKKSDMEQKIDRIRRTRDREHRKLVALHEGGGRVGLVARLRAARGHGSMVAEANDPTSDLHAPLLRHGYQARRRHADITYDPSLLSAEDHIAISKPPAWLETCHDLKKTCSGHHLPKDEMKLCERETKWSEQFLENMHNDLKKARLGAALMSAGPLHVLKPRRIEETPRPMTPVVESVDDHEETSHQSALLLQRIIRGRAVQYLMYEGRTRAAELTEELKTTHGLQKEDKIRIAREEGKAREYNAQRTETTQREDAITALVDELCGGTVSAALDFLEKELRRLKEERRQHAFILVALREKTMREAAEAGRRQKEEHRRREHDELFKHVLGVTQSTVDAYLKQIITEGVELAAEEDAVAKAKAQADKIDQSLQDNDAMSTAEQNEMVAELVQQFLLPHAHKTASRHRIAEAQRAKLEAARRTIYEVIDGAEIKEIICERCGGSLGDAKRCEKCPIIVEPQETIYRQDKRWIYTRLRPKSPEKTTEDKYPMTHEAQYLLRGLVDDVVRKSRYDRLEACRETHDINDLVDEKLNVALDARDFVNTAVEVALGERPPPAKRVPYFHTMRRVIPDAQERTEYFKDAPGPKVLPSELRRRADAAVVIDPTCLCEEEELKSRLTEMTREELHKLLPSQLRELEELRRCKCDAHLVPPSEADLDDTVTDMADYSDEDTTETGSVGTDLRFDPEADEKP